MIEQIKSFLTEQYPNTFLYDPPMTLYVRKGWHSIEDKLTKCLDIASVSITAEYQKQGIFTNLLKEVLKLNENIYIECVNNTVIHKTILGLGFTEINHQGGSVSFYKLK